MERDCHNYHHHLLRQLETLVLRGQYLRWSSRIEILFGTSTKVEVNLAFSNAVIVIVINISNHKYHVFEVINPSNISSSFSCYNPNGHCYHTRYHPYYHLHPNRNPSGGVVGRQVVRVGLKWQKLCLSFPLFRLASLRFERWYSPCQGQLWKRQPKMDFSN